MINEQQATEAPCERCGDLTPKWDLRAVDCDDGTKQLCYPCHREECDHERIRRSPQGRQYCADCGVLKPRQRSGQTDIQAFADGGDR